jgi:lysophospholipase L1-like esterase
MIKVPASHSLLPVFAALFLSISASLHAEALVKSGQTIAFMGDSITQQGASSPTGYVKLVEAGLKANDLPVKIIGAGISGHKSDQMLGRLQRDVLDKKPDVMTLSCGVNDVWHGAKGVPLEEYKKNITAIVDRCTEAGVRVVILTATPIKEQDNENNQKLAGYNAFLKELAAERKLPLADLNAAMWEELKTPPEQRPAGDYLTTDGVHMNPLGDAVMATGVLEALGLDEAQMAKAQKSWDGLSAQVNVRGQIPLAEYRKLAAEAAKQKVSINVLISRILTDALQKNASLGAPPQ